jgi:hypothetical protein
MAGTGGLKDPLLSSAVSVPGAFACLNLVLQSLCGIFSPLVCCWSCLPN